MLSVTNDIATPTCTVIILLLLLILHDHSIHKIEYKSLGNHTVDPMQCNVEHTMKSPSGIHIWPSSTSNRRE